jgi:DNA (cytosine-5)-methyltransferase 1
MLRFVDLFGGAGGFRFGLEQANTSSHQFSRGENRQGQGYDSSQDSSKRFAEHGSRSRQIQQDIETRDGGNIRRKPEEGIRHSDFRQSTDRQTRIRGGESDTSQREAGPFRCVWYCEIDKYAVKIYIKNFKEDWQPTDIRRVKARDIPAFDLLCAGFPCQSFSLAGKREGFEDTRGTLFFEIARLAKAKQPRLLLLENVFGLLSHDRGRTFEVILKVLDEVGYDAEWQVLNSKHFGVPQNRERVFIIGHLRGKPFREIFPLRQNAGLSSQEEGGELAGGKTVGALHAGAHSGGLHSSMTLLHSAFPGELRSYSEESPTISSPAGGGHLPYVANTVTDGWLMDTSHHSKPMNQYRIRRLTPLECERLQGFPDGWTSGVSDTQRYRLMGNAVTVNVIETIGRAISKASVKMAKPK